MLIFHHIFQILKSLKWETLLNMDLHCFVFQINSANSDDTRSGVMTSEVAMLNDCETICDERGCHCLSDGDRPMEEIDHLMVSTRAGGRIACFCGSFSV